MRVKQVDPHANVIRLEPGTTKNKKGLEVTMPRRVRELLLECIKGKAPGGVPVYASERHTG